MSQAKRAVRAVSDLKEHAGFWLRFVSNHVSHAFARKLLDSGVTVAEWVVLREMYGREEMSSSDIAERIGMTRGAISKLVDRLVGKALVTRQDRRDDRRFQDIALARRDNGWYLPWRPSRIRTTRSFSTRFPLRNAKR